MLCYAIQERILRVYLQPAFLSATARPLLSSCMM